MGSRNASSVLNHVLQFQDDDSGDSVIEISDSEEEKPKTIEIKIMWKYEVRVPLCFEKLTPL